MLDAVVIGGGFFGCETALELKRLGFSQILLVEREAGLLRRASFVNQARVHNGYHYPRAPATALRSRKSFERFVSEYSEAIVRDLKKYYVIARGSRVTGDQFEAFCNAIGAVNRPAPNDVERLFVPGTIERVFEVQEFAFDAVKLADRLRGRLTVRRVSLPLTTREWRWIFRVRGGAHDSFSTAPIPSFPLSGSGWRHASSASSPKCC